MYSAAFPLPDHVDESVSKKIMLMSSDNIAPIVLQNGFDFSAALTPNTKKSKIL